MKGVKLILTGRGCRASRRRALPGLDAERRLRAEPVAHIPVPAKGAATHVGEAVAFIVAETLSQARDAAEAIDIDWEILPSIIDMRRGGRPGRTAGLGRGSAAMSRSTPNMGDKARSTALRQGRRVVSLDDREQPSHLQLHGDARRHRRIRSRPKRFTLTLGSQGVHGIARHARRRHPEGRSRRSPRHHRRCRRRLRHEDLHVPRIPAGRGGRRAAQAPGEMGRRPLGPFHRRRAGARQLRRGEVAMDKRGKFLAMASTSWAISAPMSPSTGRISRISAATMMTGVYRTPRSTLHVRGIYTNTVPVDAYRGAGRPEAAYLLERLVDRAARETGMKPDAIRRKNFIPTSAMPYKTPIGDRTYDTGNFDQHMTQAMESADWAGFKDRLKAARKDGKIRGIGMATLYRVHGVGFGRGRGSAPGDGRYRDCLFRHAIERAGPRHCLRAVRGPASRPASRQDPRDPGRH